jgi:Secretion system C-terminal sorting domain
LSAVGFAQNAISTDPSEILVEQGGTITLNFTYTADGAYATQFQIFETSGSASNLFDAGDANGSPGGITVDNTAFVSEIGIGLSGSVDLVVPATFGLSVDLVSPKIYRMFGKLSATGGDTYFNPYPVVTVVEAGTLGVRILDKVSANEMFVNSASKSLEVNTANVKVNKAIVYDMTGRVVSTINNLKGVSSIDLSGLNKGVYVLKADNNKSIKFAL